MTPRFGAHDVAVVIPTRDHWDVLRRTLDSLRGQSAQGFELVVVVDGLDQQVPPLGGDVTVLEKVHEGPGAARNVGVRHTQRELIVLLGDDMIALPDLIERHILHHNLHPEPEAAVLGHVDWHPKARHGRIQRWLDWSGTQFDFNRITGEDAGAGRFYSSNVSVKRTFLLDCGGFDPEFPFVYEDIDLGIRLAAKGMTLRYAPDARTLHLHRYRLGSLDGRFRNIGTGEHIICRKHPELEPFFLHRIQRRARVAPGSPWPLLVDIIPTGLGHLRKRAERQADSWYLKRLTSSFLTGWTAGAELTELRCYFGQDFDYPFLVGRASQGRTARPDDLVYMQTAAVMQGSYTGFADEILELTGNDARVLHYRCGTGSLGLHLLDAGCRVTFADAPGPAGEYLAWRLARHGTPANLVLLTEEPDADVQILVERQDQHFDVALCLDPPGSEQETVLEILERLADVVVAVFDKSATTEVEPVLRRVRNGEVLRCRRNRSGHVLVAYRPGGRKRRPRSFVMSRFGHLSPSRSRWPVVARG